MKGREGKAQRQENGRCAKGMAEQRVSLDEGEEQKTQRGRLRDSLWRT